MELCLPPALLSGVAAASSSQHGIVLAGVAGLVAGAMSMAAGEYVSVSSQSDTERADLMRERKSLEFDIGYEKDELAGIYQSRGLEPGLARQVAEQLMAHDALGAHARDEIGILESTSARPVQAAFYSAATFTLGAALPLLVAWATPGSRLISVVAITSLVFLALLGGLAARAGGSISYGWCVESNFLGCACNGSDRWRWQVVWRSCLMRDEDIFLDGHAEDTQTQAKES